MKKIIFATGNADKMKEIRMILADLGMEIISMKEAGVSLPVMAKLYLQMTRGLRLII